MKAIQMRTYQVEAVKAIHKALARNQKQMVVEMVPGSGKGLVLAKTVEMLHEQSMASILVVTNRMEFKERVEVILFDEYRNFALIDNDRIAVTTERRVLRHPYEELTKYSFIIFYETDISESLYKVLDCREKTVISFSSKYEKKAHRLFTPENVVFAYTYQQALDEGYITPAMDARAFGPAFEMYSKQLLEQIGCTLSDYSSNIEDCGWDFVVQKGTQRIWVDCKSYKSQVVSPSAAISLLNTTVMKMIKQKIPREEIVLLLVLSKIPTFEKQVIFERYHIIVWDIENLVFYSKNNPSLLKLLSQITYFPIDYIKGQPFGEEELTKIFLKSTEEQVLENKNIIETEKEAERTVQLIQRLKDCKSGKKHSREYEDICEEILRTLFEVNYFNKLKNQHKTNDEHFRMDLIGSLKINQNNEESMHPFWQMLVQYYNSHFVVFEFKNYSNEIDQNLIYITEKYLFDAALRNVAIIISRKGFSKSAKFAAEGCLREHGKLILDVTNDDLIKMLELESGQAPDHLLEKLEEFLMGISK